VELTGLPPVSETIVVPNPFDEKLAGGNSGPTICSVALKWLRVLTGHETQTLNFIARSIPEFAHFRRAAGRA
jgi:hypothetical protein